MSRKNTHMSRKNRMLINTHNYKYTPKTYNQYYMRNNKMLRKNIMLLQAKLTSIVPMTECELNPYRLKISSCYSISDIYDMSYTMWFTFSNVFIYNLYKSISKYVQHSSYDRNDKRGFTLVHPTEILNNQISTEITAFNKSIDHASTRIQSLVRGIQVRLKCQSMNNASTRIQSTSAW